MASSSKKVHRPAALREQPPLVTAVDESPAPAVAEVSAPAETAPPVPEAVVAEVVETTAVEPAPVAEAIVEPVAEAVAEPVEAVAEPVEAAVEPPPPVEAVAPVAPVAAPAPLLAVEAPAEVKAFGDNVRAIVEKGLIESRAKFAQAKSVAEEASAAVEASYDAARGGVVAFNVKAIEALKAGADANFDLIASLASAKTVSELVALQSEFARKRFEDASSQAKALAELARKVADETAAPIKAHVAKTFKVAV